MTTKALNTDVAGTRIKRRPHVSVSGVVGGLLLIATLALAFIGPAVAPYGAAELAGAPRQQPSAAFPLGTDALGRDVFSRVLEGGVDVVLVPLLATLLAFGIGAFIGMWSGYVGGRGEALVTRIVDVLISLPPLLLAIVFISSLGSSTAVLIIVSSAFFIPRIIRIVRGATTAVAANDFVTASKLRGDNTFEIVWRDIMPNISGVLIVEFAARLSNVIMFIATLNFLGLGTQPPAASWGLMVSEMTLLLRSNPMAPLVPALLIAALAVSVNLLADEFASHLARDRAPRRKS